MEFQTGNIYKIDPVARTINTRYGRVEPIRYSDSPFTLASLQDTLWMDGVKKDDLAIFGASLDDDGVCSHDFLVLRMTGPHGQVAPTELIEKYPNHMITKELARKLSIVNEEELIQFGIESIVSAARQRFPNLRH